MDTLDPKMDNVIRAALLKFDQKGELSTVARKVGIAGGAQELRKIMNSTGKLHIMVRGMIGMHLNV